MDQVTLSVSQLRCACVDENWRAEFLAGKNPSAFNPCGGGVTVHGTAFHKIAEKFIDWAIHPNSVGKAALLDDEDSIVRQIQVLGGAELVDSLLAQEQIDSAAALSEAFFNLARRILQLRRSRPRFGSWNDIFVGQEIPINNAMLYGDSGGAVFVSGIVDSLRIHPSGELEIVDYTN
jgi:RecB family exonuclease